MSGSPPLIGELCEFFALRDFGGSNSPPSVSLRNRARFLQQTAGFVRLAGSQAGFGGSNSPPSVCLRNRERFLQQTAGFVRLADSQAGFGGCCGCSLR